MNTTRKELNRKRRKNAKLFALYKMFSWDLLFFYCVEFLFYTITKGITTSEVLIINGVYLISKIIMQIPSVTITDSIGRRKSIILGNFIVIIYLLILIFGKGVISIIIANIFCALGYDLKTMSETNLLYDSVATKGGEGLYSKIDGRGASLYYILDGITSLTAGYLFVINNYLPMILGLTLIVISTIISFKFEDIYDVKKDKKQNSIIKEIKNTGLDLKETFKFILKSKRMKAFVLFQIVFYSTIKIIDTYESDLLIDIGIPEEQYSMIIGIFSIIGGIAVSLKSRIEKKYKNRTLSHLSITYLMCCVLIGLISSLWVSQTIIPTILVLFAIQRICTAIWWLLESKYLKNFTRDETRSKITFGYEFIGAISASIFSILGGLLVDRVSTQNAFVIVGLASLSCMILVLDYMKKRMGLKPSKYKKEDITF